MKLLSLILAAVMVCAAVVPALSQCDPEPIDGTYTTSNGTLLGGRSSEAWCLDPWQPGKEGNTENAMSWDGSTLGGQWKVWGMAINSDEAVVSGSYFDEFGNGWIDYLTNYEGGEFWLSGDHLWGDGSTDYTGSVNYFNVTARASFIAGEFVGMTSNIMLMGGSFDECENCELEFVISNALLVWRAGEGDMPENYPPLLCGASSGDMFDVCCINARVVCGPNAVGESTWGAIKQLDR